MTDSTGLPEAAIRPISAFTSGAEYCGSPMARQIRSYSSGATSDGVMARRLPGCPTELIRRGTSSPRSVRRKTVPSALIRAAPGRWQTSVASCPAIRNFVDSSDP